MRDYGDEHVENNPRTFVPSEVVKRLRETAGKMLPKGEYTILTQREVLEIARHIESLEERLKRVTERDLSRALYESEG